MAGIEGRVISNTAVPGDPHPFMLTYGIGLGYTTPLTWDVAQFTGLSAPPTGQRGVSDAYGTSAVQMIGDSYGGFIHTYSSAEHNPYNLANNQYVKGWAGTDMRAPWTQGESLILSSLLQVPTRGAWFEGGAVGYLQLALHISSAGAKPGQLWWLVTVWDSRGTSSLGEDAGFDAGTATAFVLSYAAQGRRLQYAEGISGQAGKETWSGWRNFTVAIKPSMVTQAVQCVNNKYKTAYDTYPGAWRVGLAALQGEIYWPQGSNGHLGWSGRGMTLSTTLLPDTPIPNKCAKGDA